MLHQAFSWPDHYSSDLLSERDHGTYLLAHSRGLLQKVFVQFEAPAPVPIHPRRLNSTPKWLRKQALIIVVGLRFTNGPNTSM